jgi:hypothetical protein
MKTFLIVVGIALAYFWFAALAGKAIGLKDKGRAHE